MNRYEALALVERAKTLGLLNLRKNFCDAKFPKQNAFVTDPAKFVVAQCSRRAGKSTALALRFFQALEAHPNAFCPYVALTRESARNIMWGILQEIDWQHKVGCSFTESNLTMTHPNGARLQLFGADMKNFIRRLKGIKTPGAAIDEAQDMGDHLEELVDDVLSPALTDYEHSWLALTGTPGPIPRGYFYEVTEQGLYGFFLHKWSILDNPYLPNAHSFIDDIKNKRGWSDNHPTLLREWGNQWVLDYESLLIRYNSDLNNYFELPKGTYNYLLGVDMGIVDADALAVIAWAPTSPNIYLVEELITHGQAISELVAQIEYLRNKYPISKIIADEGAGGKKIAEEIRRRHAIPIHPADKARKMENVAFLNDYLRQGKFKAKKDSRFAKDSYLVQIDWEHSTPDRLKVKTSFHSDIIDAVLYSVKECPAYAYRAPKPLPKPMTPEWNRQEMEEIWEKEIEYFQNQEMEMRMGLDFL